MNSCPTKKKKKKKTVTFGHLYESLAVLDKQTIESEVWAAVYDEVKTKLIAMDPQRLGSPTASFDLHFAKEHLQFSQAYRQRGQMRISLAGKDCYLTVGCKGGGVAPELAQVVVKQLDPRWVVQGVTSALLHTAGYTDVTVEEEHAGGLPSHVFFCFFCFVGELFITQVQRKKPQVFKCKGHPHELQATSQLAYRQTCKLLQLLC